jgi:hypothetical protein
MCLCLSMPLPRLVQEPPWVNYLNFSKEVREETGYGPGIVIDMLHELGRLLHVE